MTEAHRAEEKQSQNHTHHVSAGLESHSLEVSLFYWQLEDLRQYDGAQSQTRKQVAKPQDIDCITHLGAALVLELSWKTFDSLDATNQDHTVG